MPDMCSAAVLADSGSTCVCPQNAGCKVRRSSMWVCECGLPMGTVKTRLAFAFRSPLAHLSGSGGYAYVLCLSAMVTGTGEQWGESGACMTSTALLGQTLRSYRTWIAIRNFVSIAICGAAFRSESWATRSSDLAAAPHQVDYRRFMTAVKMKSLPEVISDEASIDKRKLFNVWLECGQDRCV